MLKHKTEVKERSISVSARAIDIYFLENSESVVLELPSAEELALLKTKYSGKFSVEKLTTKDVFGLRDSYRSELQRLASKYEQYNDSSTYLVNLANLADLIGDFPLSESYLKKASEVDSSKLIRHEFGESLLKQKRFNEATDFFKNIDNDSDSHTKLRLAYFFALNGELDKTREYVKQALHISPDSYETNLFHGALSLWAGDLERAVRSFKVAIEENPHSSVAHVNLAAAYWQLNLNEKAYSSLKRSLILDPLNENAAIFYSDVCFFMSRLEESYDRVQDSITVLEVLLNYEQRTKTVWEQAARAYYFVGKEKRNRNLLLKALESIKHLESIDSGPSTWNNMGLIAWELGDKKSAKRYLNFSLKKTLDNGNGIDLPLYNLVGLLIESREYREAFNFLGPILERLINSHSECKFIDKLKLQNIVLLEATGKRADALDLTMSYLSTDISDVEVKLDLLIRVIYYFTTYQPDFEKILHYEKQTLMTLESEKGYAKHTKARALNNLAFAFLIFDSYDKASRHLANIVSLIHKDAYITATFGLAAIKKGNLTKGRSLYEKAISLLPDIKSKNQFRQRLNFEVGKAELSLGNRMQALRFLSRAAKQKDGFSYVNRDVNNLLRQTISNS